MNEFLANNIIFVINVIEALSLVLMYVMFFLKEACWSLRRVLIPSAGCLVALYIGCVTGSERMEVWSLVVWPALLGLFCSRKKVYNIFMIFPTVFIYSMLSVFSVYMVKLVMDIQETYIAGIEGLSAVGIAVDLLLLAFLGGTFFYCRRKRIDLRLTLAEIMFFMVYFLYSVFVVFVLTIFKMYLTESARVIAGTILLLFTAVILMAYWLYLILRRKNRMLKREIHETEQLLRTQLSYTESSAEKQEELGILRHDLKNHLQVIEELCAGRNLTEAEKYVRGLLDKPALERQLKITGNSVADIVLSVKREEAAKAGVEFLVESQGRLLPFMEDVDVCTLLTNLLDNALEAAGKADKGTVSVEYVPHRNFCTLVIANTVKEQITIRNNRIMGKRRYTGKENRSAHGYGLQSVEQIVKKYGGEYCLSCDERVFTAKVILPVKEPSASK